MSSAITTEIKSSSSNTSTHGHSDNIGKLQDENGRMAEQHHGVEQQDCPVRKQQQPQQSIPVEATAVGGGDDAIAISSKESSVNEGKLLDRTPSTVVKVVSNASAAPVLSTPSTTTAALLENNTTTKTTSTSSSNNNNTTTTTTTTASAVLLSTPAPSTGSSSSLLGTYSRGRGGGDDTVGMTQQVMVTPLDNNTAHSTIGGDKIGSNNNMDSLDNNHDNGNSCGSAIAAVTCTSSTTELATSGTGNSSSNSGSSSHPVSRRGGRFVSPGQRNSSTANSPGTPSKGITEQHDEEEDAAERVDSVLEYKTYRSPSRNKKDNNTEKRTDNNQSSSTTNEPDDDATIKELDNNDDGDNNNNNSGASSSMMMQAPPSKLFSTPCRSPPSSSITGKANFSLDDVKSPDGGILWLSPEPPTPKSPPLTTSSTKPVGSLKEPHYMATPTTFFMGHTNNNDNKRKSNNNNSNNDSKCSSSSNAAASGNNSDNSNNNNIEEKNLDGDGTLFDESNSNVLAWLQSPTGLFSPGGFYGTSLNNDDTPMQNKTPRTPIVSTSFFFSDVASLPRETGKNGADITPPRITSTTHTNEVSDHRTARNNHNNGVICISPMLFKAVDIARDPIIHARHHPEHGDYNKHHPHANHYDQYNSLHNTPAAVTGTTPMLDLKNVFASPQEKSDTVIRSLPLLMNDEEEEYDGNDNHNNHIASSSSGKKRPRRYSNHHHLPPRILSQRSTSSSKLVDERDGIDSVHRHLAERDLMEDEDLSVLLQLASNNNNTPRSSSIVFRSSPLTRDAAAAASETAGGSGTIDSTSGHSHNSNHDGTRDDGLSRLQLPMAGNLPQRRLNNSNSGSTHSSSHKQHDFDPPMLGMKKSNSSSGSKEIYVGQKQASSNHKKSPGEARSNKENSSKGSNSSSLPNTQAGSASYPMHYPYGIGHHSSTIPHPGAQQAASPYSVNGGPHPPMNMSGSMRVVVGGPPPPPPPPSNPVAKGSVSTGQYGEYPGMPAYPPPPYGSYQSQPSSHHHHHLVAAGYSPYPPTPHYPPPTTPHGASVGPLYSTTPSTSSSINNPNKNDKKTSSKGGSGRKTTNDTKEKSAKKTKPSSTSLSGSKRGSPSSSNLNSKAGVGSKKKKTTTGVGSPSGSTPGGGGDMIVGTSSGGITSTSQPLSAKKRSNKSPSSSKSPKKSATKLGGPEDDAALAAAILRGVTMRPSGKWQAQLYFAGKSRYIGVFDSREKAALAYEIAREKLKNGETNDGVIAGDKATTENLVNAARKAAFEGVNGK